MVMCQSQGNTKAVTTHLDCTKFACKPYNSFQHILTSRKNVGLMVELTVKLGDH